MLGQFLWSALIVLVVCVLLSEAFPGRRGPPAAPVLATMHWYTPAMATPLSFDELTDLTTCREMQRQLAQRRDEVEGSITLACRRPR